ncbi:hypothetical protein MPSEU_000187500 [Mayamaea pseudoterrestris]|nr:hypothetical protein MPSEU_000187500 [Mayamaea pseudoterrestris]
MVLPINLLNDQFQATQEYINAQTTLRNALQRDGQSAIREDNATSVVQATLQYQRALYALQDSTKAIDDAYAHLLQSGDANRRLLPLLEEHIRRTKRIISSISSTPVVHPNGVLQTQSMTIDDMTLALSALRASIRTVTDASK